MIWDSSGGAEEIGSTYITFFLALAFCFFGGDGVFDDEEACGDDCGGVVVVCGGVTVVCGGTVVVSMVVTGI